MSKFEKRPYNKNYSKIFKIEKDKIIATIPGCEVSHIGSTAVSGLGGKGILDVMIAIKDWDKAEKIIPNLKKLGFFHIHPREKGRIFLSKDRSLSSDNIHIHIVKKNSEQYREILAFRDYLKKNKRKSKEYSDLKSEWIEESQGDREKYRNLKSKYIEEIIKKF